MTNIGYGAYAPTQDAPGDRRRFIAWARQRGVTFRPADQTENHDIVYLTHNADLAGWLTHKQAAGERLKIIFELVDSYFTQTNISRRLAKAAMRRIVGTDTRYRPDFLETLRAMCRVADAVICSTEEQRTAIAPFNANVHLSLDYFANELRPALPTPDGGKLKVVWEGQGATLGNLLQIREPLNALGDRIALHVVTDPIRYRLLNRFGGRPSTRLLEDFTCPVIFHPWRIDTFSKIVSSCDVAVIPIDLDDAMARGKPENKLVMLWQCGLPVLTSPTPAYRRAMVANNVDMLCMTPADWTARLEALAALSTAEYAALSQKLRTGASNRYSAAAFRAPFDAAFTSVGYDLPPLVAPR